MGRLLVAVLLTVAVVACSKPEPPTIKPESATVTKVSAAGMTVKVVLNVYNPNDVSLSARKVSAKVVLGETVEMGPIDAPAGVDLTSGAWTKVNVEIPTTWSNVAAVASLAAGAPTVPYVVKGTVNVGGDKLNLDLPFTLKGSVKREELIAAGLKGLKIPPIPGLTAP